MEYVSFFGSTSIVLLALLILIGGVNFRKGFLILNLLGWAVLVMLVAKNYADYPRPVAVDSTLESFGKEITRVDYSELQPTGFWERFSPELLAKTRASELGRYGFPSGHVIIITAIWIGMSLLFHKRWLWYLSVFMVLLTMISRMYLGVHYLGDVLGGLIIGLIITIGIKSLFIKFQLNKGFNLRGEHLFIFLSPVVLFFFSNFIPGFQAGNLIGFNIALLVILKFWNEPELAASIVKRVINVLIFITLYFPAYYITNQLPLPKTGLLSMATYSIINFVVVFVFFYLGKTMKLYRY